LLNIFKTYFSKKKTAQARISTKGEFNKLSNKEKYTQSWMRLLEISKEHRSRQRRQKYLLVSWQAYQKSIVV